MMLASGFRLIFVIVTILFAVAGYSNGEGLQDKRGAAGQEIETSELEFQNVIIQPAEFDGYEFVGQIQNNSDRHTLTSVEISITIYDCIKKSGSTDCAVIGERKESIYLTIPPQQRRRFKVPIYSYGDVLTSQGELAWEYKVLSTTAASTR